MSCPWSSIPRLFGKQRLGGIDGGFRAVFMFKGPEKDPEVRECHTFQAGCSSCIVCRIYAGALNWEVVYGMYTLWNSLCLRPCVVA